jgi:hypothetical protein
MNQEDLEVGKMMDEDIRQLADQGVALLMQGARLAGERGTKQARAFNGYLRWNVAVIQAQTVNF